MTCPTLYDLQGGSPCPWHWFFALVAIGTLEAVRCVDIAGLYFRLKCRLETNVDNHHVGRNLTNPDQS